MNEEFIDLDFHHGLPSHSFVDRKAEVRVNIGRLSSLPPSLQQLQAKYGNVLLGIQDAGMPRDRLDHLCRLLALDCKSLRIEMVVSKSDRPFDSQWYFFGNLERLLKAAQDNLVKPPFTTAMHDHIRKAISIISDH